MDKVIIALVLGLILVGAAGGLVFYVRNRIRRFSKQFLGTEELIKGFKDIEKISSETPKSVSAMTSLYLPKIKKDFPEFEFNEMKGRAENVLTSYLSALSTRDAASLSEGTAEFREKVAMQIQDLRNREVKVNYTNKKIHRTEISDYKKREGRCIITFQSAIQYMYTMKNTEGKLVEGNEQLYTQGKYNIDLIYIQDRNLVVEDRDHALGVNCPNCGAPISMLGRKTCEYCGTPIVEVNLYAWNFSDVKSVD